MPEFILSPQGARRVDERLARAGLLDLAMEEAGRGVADLVATHCAAGRVLLLAGGGANGGDAFVAARHLRVLGRDVDVLALPSAHPLTRLNRRRWRAVGGETGLLSPRSLRRALAGAGVVVDGLLGTGFTPPLRPTLAAALAQVQRWREQRADRWVVAIDLPSGLDAASAEVTDEVAQADHTVSFMGWKPALLFGAAAARAGQVTLLPLRVVPGWVQEHAQATRPTDAEIAARLPRRRADAHKGSAGRVWIVGGHPGTTGAAALAGVGALRAGAGLVTIHSQAEVPLVTPELMVRRHPDWPAALGELGRSPLPDALAVGMGLGPEAVTVARAVLAWNIPTVLDADALQAELAGAGHDRCIWTPHPGEAARLLGTDTRGISRDPLAAAQALQSRLGGVVVLKGGPSVVAHPAGLAVARGGHPGMASAGMGDTLSGVLAALLGQGLDATSAALAGVRLHARAGERAGLRHGYGLIATDVAGELGSAWADVQAGKQEGRAAGGMLASGHAGPPQ